MCVGGELDVYGNLLKGAPRRILPVVDVEAEDQEMRVERTRLGLVS